MTNEIKSLIKQHRRDGRTGDLDLNEVQKLSERQLRKRHSTVFNAERPTSVDIRPEEEQVWSRVAHQLAWERDIDLTASNNTVKTGALVEESDEEDGMTSSHTSRTFPPNTPDPPRTSSSGRRRAFDNAAFESDSLHQFAAMRSDVTPPAGATRVLGRNNRVSPDVSIAMQSSARTQAGESKRSSFPMQSSSKSSLNSDASSTSLIPAAFSPAQDRPPRPPTSDVDETGV